MAGRSSNLTVTELHADELGPVPFVSRISAKEYGDLVDQLPQEF
ncbi:hypothetical protein GA0070607_6483 [Micromonospora coriariae]|uniref:Uncharacterized protein n=1 Tax=Micromonospora coriariae TaxID=285665 RepID=A0A1C4YA79_9ACTN|nr:hypothetical protein GA0070607_6483 [Micromonospora coriariae]